MSLSYPLPRSRKPRPGCAGLERSRPPGSQWESRRRTACSNPVKPRADMVRDVGRWAYVARRRRQDLEECPAVVASEDAVVQDDDRAAIGGTADQATESLLQTERRLRQRQLPERVAHLLRTRRIDRVGRHREGKAYDDDAAQPLAGDVDPLPEGRGAQEQRARGFLECLEQLAALTVDALAEDEHLVEVDAVLERRMHVAQLPMRCEEGEGASSDSSSDLRDDVDHRRIEALVLRKWKVGRQADQRLMVEIERRWKDELLDLRAETDS